MTQTHYTITRDPDWDCWYIFGDTPDEDGVYCRGIHETFDSAILHSDILSLEGAFN